MIDNKAFYNISSGLYLVTVNNKLQQSGCIINTFLQVASSPKQVIISLTKDSYTRELIDIKKSFHVSVLPRDCEMDVIENFGFKTGRDTSKFADYEVAFDKFENPYLSGMVSDFSCEIVDELDLGSHILYIAEVREAFKGNDKEVLTYEYYQSNMKGKTPPKAASYNEANRGKFRCTICGYVAELDELPDDYICPICKAPKEKFVKLS